MFSIFEKIVSGDIPSYQVNLPDVCSDLCAILDINPITEGHVLLFPKRHTSDYLYKLNNESDNLSERSLLEQYTIASKIITKKLKTVIGCENIDAAIIGYDLPHPHLHIIPDSGGYSFNYGEQNLRQIGGNIKGLNLPKTYINISNSDPKKHFADWCKHSNELHNFQGLESFRICAYTRDLHGDNMETTILPSFDRGEITINDKIEIVGDKRLVLQDLADRINQVI